MNRSWIFLIAVSICHIGAISGLGGAISYTAIPASKSDQNSGIGQDHRYTTALDAGNTRGIDRTVNGIRLYSLVGKDQTAGATDNCIVHPFAGNLTAGGLTNKDIPADGTIRDILSDMLFNNAAGDNSQLEIVLDPDSLERGSTYDLRLYVCSYSGQDRQVNLTFFGDGLKGSETGFFNEDDARTSPGKFQSGNQVYFINYRYVWDGAATPGVMVMQKFGGAPFCLYALTNEFVAGPKPVEPGRTDGGIQPEAGEENFADEKAEPESDRIGVKSDEFYGADSLNSHGRWIKLPRWGAAWQPTDVSPGWAPYTNGTWRQSARWGWTFVSEEPWSWACYHYGRWAKVNVGCGWAWVPGRLWAASWVSWRQPRDDSSSWIGWAPLPPEAGCEPGIGISSWVDSTSDIGPGSYTFINIRDFGANSYLGCGCIAERSRNSEVLTSTVNCTNIVYDPEVKVYCSGPDFESLNARIRQLGGKESNRLLVRRFESADKLGGQLVRRDADELGLVSPRVQSTKHPKQRPQLAESLDDDQIEHGWEAIDDRKQERELRKYIAQETKGKTPNRSPAKLPANIAAEFEKRQAAQKAAVPPKEAQAEDQQTAKGARHRRRHGAKGSESAANPSPEPKAGFDQHPVKTVSANPDENKPPAAFVSLHPGQPIHRGVPPSPAIVSIKPEPPKIPGTPDLKSAAPEEKPKVESIEPPANQPAVAEATPPRSTPPETEGQNADEGSPTPNPDVPKRRRRHRQRQISQQVAQQQQPQLQGPSQQGRPQQPPPSGFILTRPAPNPPPRQIEQRPKAKPKTSPPNRQDQTGGEKRRRNAPSPPPGVGQG